MIYTLEEHMLFSVIYSQITQSSFVKQVYSSDILFRLFKLSIEKNINIFTATHILKKEIIEEALVKLKIDKPKIDIEKRREEMNNLFLDNEKIENFKKQVEKEINLCETNNIKTIPFCDEKYPTNLKELIDSPFVVYYKGYFPKENELKKSLAIIGTREPDDKYGKKVALKTGKLLLDNAWWNISGLAVGCDEYGHKGSIGATGAILGQGLATPVFPKENRNLAQDLLDNAGFLMSELPPSTKSNGIFFILRDRLQSGLTRGIFVVETSCNSGTLHTVKYALEQKRKVYVWDCRKIKDLVNIEAIEGNKMLLDSNKKYKSNVSISRELKKEIIPVENSTILLEFLKVIEQEDRQLDKDKIALKTLQNSLF